MHREFQMPHRKLHEIVAGQDLLYAAPDTPVADVVSAMQERRFSAVPVLEDGELRGIFTSSNFIKRVLDAKRDTETTAVGDVMTPDPCCLDADCQGLEAIRLMKDRKIRHIVVRGCGAHGYAVVTAADFPDNEIAEFEDELSFEQRLWEEL